MICGSGTGTGAGARTEADDMDGDLERELFRMIISCRSLSPLRPLVSSLRITISWFEPLLDRRARDLARS